MQNLFVRLLAVMALCVPVWFLIRLLYIKIKKIKPEFKREVFLAAFICFAAGLFALVFQPGNNYYAEVYGKNGHAAQDFLERLRTGRDINLVPFKTISQFFSMGFSNRFIINIIANVLMFAPFGFCLPFFWPRWQKAWRVLLFGIGLSCSIEFLQLFIGRSTDIDDCLLNVAGVMFGYLIYVVGKKIKKK